MANTTAKSNTRQLKIAQLAPPFFDVPPRNYGGSEIVISHLTEELVKRGHDVTLFATGQSKTKAKLEWYFPKALGLGEPAGPIFQEAEKFPWTYSLPYLFHSILPFEKAAQFDIIHNHFHKHGLLFANLVKTPTLTTIHGGTASTERPLLENYILEKYKNNFFAAISQSQKNNLSKKLKNTAVVHHGLPLSKFSFSPNPGEHLLFLGKIAEKKGVLEAIKVAKLTKQKLIIAGSVNPADEQFFKKQVLPKLKNNLIKYIGPVNHAQKVAVLQKAKALLYPILWEEPFGLVIIEAMACGVPVVAFNRGAVPEIIKHNHTGFIVNTLPEMASALKKISAIRRHDCRARVEQNFSVEKMANKYEKLYYSIIKKSKTLN